MLIFDLESVKSAVIRDLYDHLNQPKQKSVQLCYNGRKQTETLKRTKLWRQSALYSTGFIWKHTSIGFSLWVSGFSFLLQESFCREKGEKQFGTWKSLGVIWTRKAARVNQVSKRPKAILLWVKRKVIDSRNNLGGKGSLEVSRHSAAQNSSSWIKVLWALSSWVFLLPY